MSFGKKWVRWVLLGAGLLLLALLLVWSQRNPIAKRALDGYFADRGVPASYEIKAIGTKLQRIENIRIGDPAHPDLTARWAELDVSPALSGFTLRAVRASGVRVRGRLVGGVLNFGAVDKLLPAPSGKPFELPDIDLTLTDSQLALASDYGVLGLMLSGKGNVRNSFSGYLGANAPRLAGHGCAADAVRLEGSFSLQSQRPAFKGPATVARLNCGSLGLQSARLLLDGSANATLNQWTGHSELSAASGFGGGATLRALSLQTDFSGTKALTRGQYRAATGPLAHAQGSARSSGLSGHFELGMAQDGALIAASQGSIDTLGAAPSRALQARLARVGTAGGGTALGPITKALAVALAKLNSGSRLLARYDLSHQAGRGSIALSGVQASNAGGARLSLSGTPSIRSEWPSGKFALSGSATLSGGGFPASNIAFYEGRSLAGRAIIAPMSAGGTRLALTPVSFTFTPAGLQLDTLATLDGPIASGRISGFHLPLSLRPGRSALSGCVPTGFRSLEISGLRLAPTRLTACLSADEVRVASPRLTGLIGRSPITLSAQSARFGISGEAFEASGLAVRLGAGEPDTLLDVPELSGKLNPKGASGTLSGATGRIGAVPLLLSQGSGNWQLASSVFTLQGGARMADANESPRFNPLIANDLALKLLDGVITASATAREPTSGLAVTRITLSHTLSSGTGQAGLDVSDLAFGAQLQPELITPLTFGVIANVVGRIDGQGQIRWTPDGVTSTGGFRTDNLDLAAAFGPVTGMSGEIALSDLLGLTTPPGQSVHILSINPGIAVINGEIKYRLLPGLKAEIEGGRWPFAGGALILEPTVFDLSEAAERKLTFRVEGLNAAQFINQLQFENVSASGIFDGTLPMIFDKNGGRIEGGRLIARDGGGTLAYVGEISNENLGTMGRFAFDALKSIRYNRLSIDLGGPIDGDIVTRVSFAGVNQAPLGAMRSKLPLPIKINGLTNFPFIFNVTITAPFRKLFDMSRTISDPSLLIERLNPNLERVGPAKAIQPAESGPVRKKP